MECRWQSGGAREGWAGQQPWRPHIHTHTHTYTHTHIHTNAKADQGYVYVCECRKGGGQWPHKTGRKENKGRKGCTVCADQECLLKTKPIKASGIKTRSVWRGTLIAAAWSLVSTRSPLVSGNYRAWNKSQGGKGCQGPWEQVIFTLSLSVCVTVVNNCSLYKYHQPSSWKPTANGGFQGKSMKTKWDICYLEGQTWSAPHHKHKLSNAAMLLTGAMTTCDKMFSFPWATIKGFVRKCFPCVKNV